MFGGIAPLGSDGLVYATVDGHILTFHTESGELLRHQALYPLAPREVHIAACATDPARRILLADSRHGRVRVIDPDGVQRRRIGGLATPGVEHEDVKGILHKPCALLWVEEGLWVALAGERLEHAVQCFDARGEYRFSARHPEGEWSRPSGLARIGDEVWIADPDANAVWRCDLSDGRATGPVELDTDLIRPFRIVADGHEGALVLLAPGDEEDGSRPPGVARLDGAGAFEEWAVHPGEDPGRVASPFDLATLPDGRFVVADLPFGQPPDVRLQLFSADGRLLRVILEDAGHLDKEQTAWFKAMLLREPDEAGGVFYQQARIHHYHGEGREREAAELYRRALERDPDALLARLGLADLMLESFLDAPEAESHYRAALAAGIAEAEILARIAECRHAQGDLDGAARILRQAVESDDQPEEYHRRVEILGSWFLERAGEAPEELL